MAPQKLSESDKQDILALYRATEETTSSLADRYGVSNTTISRILKQSMSTEEYESLVQQKRSGGFKNQPSAKSSEATAFVQPSRAEQIQAAVVEPEPLPVVTKVAASDPKALPRRRQRQPSVADEQTLTGVESETSTEPIVKPAEPEFAPVTSDIQLPLLELSAAMASQNLEVQAQSNTEAHPLKEMIEGDLLSSEEDFTDLDEDEDDGDDLDDDLEDEDEDDDGLDEDGGGDLSAVQVQSKAFIRVLPLSEASIPKTCYLVVDRASELITRPLRDFAELGQIPTEEIQAKTLPVFDNHRVARRFSRRMQRVVKVPDGRVLQKVGSYLQAKGITRLLIDGQVYSI